MGEGWGLEQRVSCQSRCGHQLRSDQILLGTHLHPTAQAHSGSGCDHCATFPSVPLAHAGPRMPRRRYPAGLHLRELRWVESGKGGARATKRRTGRRRGGRCLQSMTSLIRTNLPSSRSFLRTFPSLFPGGVGHRRRQGQRTGGIVLPASGAVGRSSLSCPPCPPCSGIAAISQPVYRSRRRKPWGLVGILLPNVPRGVLDLCRRKPSEWPFRVRALVNPARLSGAC